MEGSRFTKLKRKGKGKELFLQPWAEEESKDSKRFLSLKELDSYGKLVTTFKIDKEKKTVGDTYICYIVEK